MDDSRYTRLLTALQTMATVARSAETTRVRELADELPEHDQRRLALLLAARFCDETASRATDVLRENTSRETA